MTTAPATTAAPAATPCWCSATAAHTLFTITCAGDLHFSLRRCAACSVVRLAPQPTDTQLMAYYDPTYYGPSPAKFVEPIATLVRYCQASRARLVRAHVPPPAKVLDVGCGNGNVLAQLGRQGYETHGTELTPKSAARIPPDAGITVHVGDILDLDLPPESFDVVTLWHVLEHLRHPDQAARKIARLMKKDAWLLLSVPNAESPEAALFARHWFHLDAPRHLFGFGPRSLAKMLDTAGLELVWFRTWSFEQNPYGFMQSCLNAAGFAPNRAYETLKHWRTSPRFSRLVDLASLAALAPLGLGWSTALSLMNRGATMTAGIRKRPA